MFFVYDMNTDGSSQVKTDQLWGVTQHGFWGISITLSPPHSVLWRGVRIASCGHLCVKVCMVFLSAPKDYTYLPEHSLLSTLLSHISNSV